jgi:hypothetical protein
MLQTPILRRRASKSSKNDLDLFEADHQLFGPAAEDLHEDEVTLTLLISYAVSYLFFGTDLLWEIRGGRRHYTEDRAVLSLWAETQRFVLSVPLPSTSVSPVVVTADGGIFWKKK